MAVLSLPQAQQLVASAFTEAESKQQNIAVAVVDAHGELMAFARHQAIGLPSIQLAQNKAYTAARERQPSGNLGQWARETGKDMGYWGDAKVTGFKGGVPMFVDGACVGAVGVSGLSEEEDEALANLAIASL